MKKKISAKFSTYTLDGVAQELTPARILDSCLQDPGQSSASNEVWEPIVDETLDPSFNDRVADPSMVVDYASKVRERIGSPRSTAKSFPELTAKSAIASALIDIIWRRGHFTLQDLLLKLDWRWPEDALGDHASFYAAVSAAADYVDSLGLKLRSWTYRSSEMASLEVKPVLAEPSLEDDEMEEEDPYSLRIGRVRARPSVIQGRPSDWIIFIPFDDCDFRLGGSRLSEVESIHSDAAPRIIDADYFIDCYEVVRELVEDGVVISGASVGEGGLMTALLGMAEKHGVDIDLGELASARGEKDVVRLLFSEVPGVLIQIADIDYDYVDAELLLQDVAYFPLGHPKVGDASISVASSARTGIKGILESLIRSQSSEGED